MPWLNETLQVKDIYMTQIEIQQLCRSLFNLVPIFWLYSQLPVVVQTLA
jgi:hypothetical protein